MYAMPMGGSDGKYKVFFEETSLVARPPMTIEECKRRMYLRLKHLGVKVRFISCLC
jgi:lycopene beta-cyclase